MHPEYILRLKQQLSKPLPGAAAHQQMAPAHRLSSEHYLKTIKDYREGSVLILLYELNGVPHFVLTLRPSYEGIHSGQISLPGGKIEQSDANPVETALRETEEEIGVSKANIEIIGTLTSLYIPPSNFLVHPVLGYAKQELKFKKDEREVAELIDVATSILLVDALRQHKMMDLSRGLNAPDLTQVKVPYFNIGGHHVWGATAMILSEFAEIHKAAISQNI